MIHLTRNLRHWIVNPSIAHKRSVVHTDRKHSFVSFLLYSTLLLELSKLS